jgi:hypothetical protein
MEMHLRVFGVPSLRHECLIDWRSPNQVERCERIVRSSELLSHHFQLSCYWMADLLAMHGVKGANGNRPSFGSCWASAL